MGETPGRLEYHHQSSFSASLFNERPRAKSDTAEALDRSGRTDLGGPTRGTRSRANTDNATFDSSSAPVPEPPRGPHIQIQNNSKFIVDVEIKWRNRPKQVNGIRRRGWLARLGITSNNVDIGVKGGADNEEHFNFENSAELKQRLEPQANGEIAEPIIFEKQKECDDLYIILKACIEPKDNPTMFKMKAYYMTEGSYDMKATDTEIMAYFDNDDLQRLKRVRAKRDQVIRDTFGDAYSRRENTIRLLS